MLLYCVLMWVVFTLAFWLADNQHRWKDAMISALLNLVLVSVLALLGSYAAAQLGTSMTMTTGFQLVGVLICSMAVSRIGQMLSWPRTLLAAMLNVTGYIVGGLILAWLFIHMAG
ncbi:MAG: hypothetical protein IKK73_02175 [Akkermansia sp.]|nr:hypothetical protein [Akkermansia sp.]